MGQGKYAPSYAEGQITVEDLGDWENIPVRVTILFGEMTKGNIPSGERSKFSCERYKFFLNDGAPSISCCPAD